MTGPTIPDVLEAAHISPHRGMADNHPQNGLLLRADIHTLFDLDLVGIDPTSFTIHVHPTARAAYAQLGGIQLGCDRQRLSSDALTRRWQAFLRNGGMRGSP